MIIELIKLLEQVKKNPKIKPNIKAQFELIVKSIILNLE
jgi:hypothetical protein